MTTLTDSFDRTDQEDLGTSSEGWSWTRINGISNSVDIVTNKAQTSGLADGPLYRADSDLASDDHYAQAIVSATSEANPALVGVACRMPSTATNTAYRAEARFDNDTFRLSKIVSGSETSLAAPATTFSVGNSYTVKVQADGSTIKSFLGGIEVSSVTDESISGNVRCGIRGDKHTTGVVTWDDFEAADLGAAPAATKRYTLTTLGVG